MLIKLVAFHRPPAIAEEPLLSMPVKAEIRSLLRSSGVKAGVEHLQVENLGPSTVPLHRRQCNLMEEGKRSASSSIDELNGEEKNRRLSSVALEGLAVEAVEAVELLFSESTCKAGVRGFSFMNIEVIDIREDLRLP